MVHRIFLAAFFLLPLGAALVAPRLPAILVLPGVLLLSCVLFALHVGRLHRVGGSGSTGRLNPYAAVEDELRRLQGELGRASTKLVHSNLRLLGLSEIWGAMAHERQAERVFDGILSFCRREAGFAEAAVLRVEGAAEELVGVWSRPEGDERIRCALAGVDGGVARVLQSARRFHCEKADEEPVLLVNGEPRGALSELGSYLMLPLLSPMPRPECLDGGWLYREGCPGFESSRPAQTRALRRRGGRGGLDLSPCIGCRHYPLHGVLIVTDRGRPGGISRADALGLESLTSTVAAVMDHAALYREVRAAQRFREQILEAMEHGLVTTDQHGRVVFANRRARDMRGGAGVWVGERLQDHLRFPGGGAVLQHTLLEGRTALHTEALLEREGQGPLPVRTNLTPFRSARGALQGAVCVFEDLSGVRAMEDEIRHLDTLAAIGRFASSLAHEVRNPLGGISAGVNWLRRSDGLGEEARENLDVIQGEVSRLDGIIRSLLVVARPREMELAALSLVAVTKDVIRALQPWAREKSIDLLLELGDGLIEPIADRDMVQQVLLNLVKNAVEASPPGRPVSVRLEGGTLDGDEPAARVVVEDRGPGLSAEDLPHLFEPFYSRKAEGTGLGLYVCHNFVQRHGGVLRAQPRPGGGSCFEMLLPEFPARLGGRHEATSADRR